VGVKEPCQLKLFGVAQAINGQAFGLRFAQGWQEHPRQNCNNRDDYQQLDQREGAVEKPDISRNPRKPRCLERVCFHAYGTRSLMSKPA